MFSHALESMVCFFFVAHTHTAAAKHNKLFFLLHTLILNSKPSFFFQLPTTAIQRETSIGEDTILYGEFFF